MMTDWYQPTANPLSAKRIDRRERLGEVDRAEALEGERQAGSHARHGYR